jgi:hypothetical protein
MREFSISATRYAATPYSLVGLILNLAPQLNNGARLIRPTGKSPAHFERSVQPLRKKYSPYRCRANQN